MQAGGARQVPPEGLNTRALNQGLRGKGITVTNPHGAQKSQGSWAALAFYSVESGGRMIPATAQSNFNT